MAIKGTASSREATRLTTAERAYAIWESEGRPHGRDQDHWRRAEAEIGGTGRGRGVPAKVAAAMTAASGEAPTGRATRAASKPAAKATKKAPTGSRTKR